MSSQFIGEGRKHQPREMLLVSEFLSKFHAGDRTWQRVRLGSVPEELELEGLEEEERRMLGVWRRWADAVVFDGTKVTIYEAAIIPTPGDIGMLEMYLMLFPMTPEFEAMKDLPREGAIIAAVEDPVTAFLARQKGYRYIVFTPSWVPDYIRQLRAREGRARIAGKEIQRGR